MLSNLSLVVFLVKATIILVAALGITLAMQRSSAGARHLVWLVALGALLLVPALTAWSPLRVAILPAPPVDLHTPTSAASIAAPAPSDAAISTRSVVEAGGPIAPAPDAGPGTRRERIVASLGAMSGLSMLFALWALVAAAIAITLGWAGLAVRRIVKRARPLETADWRTPLYEIADRLGLDEAPRLLCSDDAKMPFACGMLTPTIVLPAECERWTIERRRAVLLHELAHVRRHDLVGHTIGRLACAAYWFHPLVWTAAKQLRSESERACDDLALECGTSAPDYAEHLLDIVTSVRRDATPLVALAMARRKEFEGRMLAILDPELRHAGPSRRQSLTLISTLALIAVTVGAAAPVPRATRQQPAAPARQAVADTLSPRLHDDAEPVDLERDAGDAGSIARRVATRTAAQTAKAVERELAPRSDVRENIRENLAESLGTSVSSTVSTVTSTAVSAALQGIFGGSASHGRNADERATLLAKVLRTDSSSSLRRVAAWGLGEYADAPVAVEALSTAVRRDADASVREMAAWALGQSDDDAPAATDALTSALRGDADKGVRTTAAWALGNMGDRAAVDALVSALSDGDPRLRTRALWAIGNISPKQAPPAVIALLRDGDVRVRRLAAWTLYQIEDPAAVPALESALKVEQSSDVQLADIRALAALGEKSVDALRGLLESSDPKVKSMAVHALAGGHAAGPWPWPWPEPRPFPH